MFKLNKKMVGTKIYRENTFFNSEPLPTVEAIITKVGSKYIYINNTQYEINRVRSTSDFFWLNGKSNNSIIIFTTEEKYKDHLCRKEVEKKLRKMINQSGNSYLYSIPIENIKQIAELLLLNSNE